MKTRLCKLTVASALLILLISTHGYSQGDTFLTRVQGKWLGEGTVFGSAAVVQIKWEWVLAGKFMRLDLRHEVASNSSKQVFEGQAYYQPQGVDKYAAHWFDSRGVTFPIKAYVEGNTLTSLWGSPDKEEGKSTYQLVDDSTLRVVDSVKQNDIGITLGVAGAFGLTRLMTNL